MNNHIVPAPPTDFRPPRPTQLTFACIDSATRGQTCESLPGSDPVTERLDAMREWLRASGRGCG